ncbi:MAG TPA: SDR family oxidoreductase [Candidatus Baltobacteraceae bacterium]|jgi:hypothetical protein|nr:SDR family oxidoreductase [Candidatus Baltobacteraceae bacterium]
MASKLALVTGGSGGIGLECARLLAQAGYDLALVARSAGKLEAAATELRTRFGISAQYAALDLTAAGAVEEVAARFPRCEVLVNNAGFANSGRFTEIPAQALAEEITLNVGVLTQLTRIYLPGMLARRTGRILNLASTAAFVPGPFMAVYYATKAYVLSFSEAIAAETRGTGVTVTVLCPGPTITGFQERAGVRNTLLFRLGAADASRVAKAGIQAMFRGKTVVVPGTFNKLVALSPRIAPRALVTAISKRLTAQTRS